MLKVSIIVPVFNVQNYLAKCLDTLINQSIDNYEIIIVNDGSTDNSQVIIDQYANKYSDRIKAYYKKNEGLGLARNYGIDRALGEYIGFVDSDDWVCFDMFDKLYQTAKINDSDITYCGYFQAYATEVKSVVPNATDGNKYKIFVESWNKIYRRSYLNTHGLRFNKLIHEDLDLYFRMLTFTDKISVCPHSLYYYNKANQNSIMNTVKFHPDSYITIVNNAIVWRKKWRINDRNYDARLLHEFFHMILYAYKDDFIMRKFVMRHYFSLSKIANFSCVILFKLCLIILSPSVFRKISLS